MKMTQADSSNDGRVPLLYHYCRLQLPRVAIAERTLGAHLRRMFTTHRQKSPTASWPEFMERLHVLDAFLAAGCLDGDAAAWQAVFDGRTGRSDQLLVDALRARSVRLYPHDEEKQDSAVADFWGHLLVAESPGAVPILARYDGQRPLVPWLIRVFHNWQISQLRSPGQHAQVLADDDHLPDPTRLVAPDARWHEVFCDAAREWLHELSDQDALVLGLRMRYRLSQREVARLLGVHEGTVSRLVTSLRDRCLGQVTQRLQAEGWTGDDMDGLLYSEMATLLLDEPLLSADRLSGLLAAQGKALPH